MHESRLVHSTHPPIDRLDANARVLCTRAGGCEGWWRGRCRRETYGARATRGGVWGVGWGGARATGVGGGVGRARGVCAIRRGVCVCVCVCVCDDFE